MIRSCFELCLKINYKLIKETNDYRYKCSIFYYLIQNRRKKEQFCILLYFIDIEITAIPF